MATGGRKLVVIRRKQAAAERFHAKRREIIASYVLRAQRFSGESAALPPNAQTLTTCLKGSHIFEFRCLCFQRFVERKGELPHRSCGPPSTQQSSPSPTRYSSAGSETGNERNMTAWIIVKIAVVPPIPKASVSVRPP